jgi:hypothetical protein
MHERSDAHAESCASRVFARENTLHRTGRRRPLNRRCGARSHLWGMSLADPLSAKSETHVAEINQQSYWTSVCAPAAALTSACPVSSDDTSSTLKLAMPQAGGRPPPRAASRLRDHAGCQRSASRIMCLNQARFDRESQRVFPAEEIALAVDETETVFADIFAAQRLPPERYGQVSWQGVKVLPAARGRVDFILVFQGRSQRRPQFETFVGFLGASWTGAPTCRLRHVSAAAASPAWRWRYCSAACASNSRCSRSCACSCR